MYDSLNPDWVSKALDEAIHCCRPNWSKDFKNWILGLIQLSIDSSIGEFNGKFYKQKNGLPTGGSLIVQIANITVFFILNRVLYSNKKLMRGVADVKRYIDDGIGVHFMTPRAFTAWKKEVSSKVKTFDLEIKESDWNSPDHHNGSVNFLDVKFWFDKEDTVQTDLYQKPTDARHYLHFSSCHPNHVFSGIVYGQCLRLRKIINNDSRLAKQLNRLKEDFLKCKYPAKLVENIMRKVKLMERDLKKKKDRSTAEKDQRIKDQRIMAVTTHGRDQPLVKMIKKIEKNTSLKFRNVKKTASSLCNLLVRSKNASLGCPYGPTTPCTSSATGRCLCCKLVSKSDHIYGPDGKIIRTAGGKCSTRCLIYHARCILCEKCYAGKTVQRLNERVNGHRGKYYDCLNHRGDRRDLDEEDHALGLHLYFHHNLRHRRDFNESFKFTILERCNPLNIDLKEHLWIQRLKCIKPYGLNSHDPFGIPLLL